MNDARRALRAPVLAHVLLRRADEPSKERVRAVRTRLELGVELAADEEGELGKLDHLDELAVRRDSRDREPRVGERLAIGVVDLEAVAVPLRDLERANSSEFNADTPDPVIDLMLEQRSRTKMGGTMRLGAYPCRITEGSLAHRLYGALEIAERHRHRFEVNNAYRKALTDAGLAISGVSPDGELVEMVELPQLPFFIGCQFHPELKSRPNRAHPLFRGLVAAAKEYKHEHEGAERAPSVIHQGDE